MSSLSSMEKQQRGRRREEKILVSVRVRPLSKREIVAQTHDRCAWECTGDSRTILCNPTLLPHRSPHPKSYTFDNVFGPECNTQRVYEKGAKDVALSALTGLNATIFAYGQTSSGKTYTMRGITEFAFLDIYNYIHKQGERDFLLKFSAIEIYNEAVKDLLNPDSGPLRLMDDPERGTIIERLAEEIVQDTKHLRQMLTICEAQRQVGETTSNDKSSRSHQIIRLSVESFPRGVPEEGPVNSLMASLNFVDLAGSERVSQTMADGTRLKEGCHINKSLLALTTVIRRLSGSGGMRNGHLPYRDSKLTRILQNSLGGNSRTAVICTLSPALSHVEQSRNTLQFASRAKEVTNSAQVNMVLSEKVLLKQLQKEVARLEAELRVPEPDPASETEALLLEKDAKIVKMEVEMRELMRQRDDAQTRLDELLSKIQEEEQSKCLESSDASPFPLSEVSFNLLANTPVSVCKSTVTMDDNNTHEEKEAEEGTKAPISNGLLVAHTRSATQDSMSASVVLVQEIRKLELLQEELGEDANRALEALQREVQCLRLAGEGMNPEVAAAIAKLQAEIHHLHREKTGHICKEEEEKVATAAQLKDEIIMRLQSLIEGEKSHADTSIASLEEQLDNVQKSIENLVFTGHGDSVKGGEQHCQAGRTTTTVKTSGKEGCASSTNGSGSKFKTPSPRRRRKPSSLNGGVDSSPLQTRRSLFENNENNPPPVATLLSNHENGGSHSKTTTATTTMVSALKTEEGEETLAGTPTRHRRTNPANIQKMQNVFKSAAEENIKSIRAYVNQLKERVTKLQYQKQLLVCQLLELEANGNQSRQEDGRDSSSVEQISLAQYSPKTWQSMFERQRNQIIDLWDKCQVSILHRTQFYLLFSGDPSDAIYLEVELRRLTWLHQHLLDSTTSHTEEEQAATTLAASSTRSLKREREMLAKRMKARLTEEEREVLFARWGIPLDSKQRKMQLANKLWIVPNDEQHIEESAQVVARVVRFRGGGEESNNTSIGTITKEMFELSFAPPNNEKPWPSSTWNPLLTLFSS